MADKLERIQSYISATVPGAAGVTLTAETRLRRDLGLDSLRLVDVVVGLEELFEVVFSDSDLDPAKLRTIADLLALVERTQGTV